MPKTEPQSFPKAVPKEEVFKHNFPTNKNGLKQKLVLTSLVLEANMCLKWISKIP